MRMRPIVLLLMLLFFVAVVPVTASTIDIPGTGDGVGVLKSIAEAYQKKTGVEVRIPDSIGSSGGVVAAGSGKVPLARVARKPKEKESHFGLSYKPIFKVPTVFFVNAKVSVENLTAKQVLDIFAGKVTNWKQVGGNDAPINLVCREQKDSSYNNLKQSFPGFRELVISPRAMVAQKTPHMVKFVLHEDNAIGFGPLDVALIHGLKVISIDGVKPTDAGYPYFGTIGLVYKPEKLDKLNSEFLGFLESAEAAAPIRTAGGLMLK